MRISDWSSDVCSSDLRSTRQVIGVLETAPGAQGRILLDIMNGRTLYVRGQEQPVYLPLRMPAMPNIPARMRSSLNRFNRSEERRVGKEGVSTGSSRWSPDH